MLLYNARKSNSGFTLIEIMVVTIIIGVIAAIAAPNFLGLLNRNRITDAAQQVEGALKEAQRQALRTGKSCTVNINTTDKKIENPSTTPPTNGCLLTNRDLDSSSSSIQLNSNTTSIVFSGKGNITGGTAPTLVVSMSNGSPDQKCVVLEGLFATLRSGKYSGTLSPPVATSCQ
jgi:prepilin-type N-terminal cleavage/methylation domain-containing protein